MKLFLDTNALIDLTAPREPYASDVRRLCIAAHFGDVQLWTTTQSYADAYYVLCRSASESEVRQTLIATLEFFLVSGTFAADLKPALQSEWRDVEDYLIAHAALRSGAELFITRDSELADKSPVRAMTASEALRYLEDELGLVYDEISLTPEE
ncbi:PIN domain-containing protein [Adlercreutzia sp. R21]|uniref:type II toxin-antitoxin system VapC family toxin n=1 Tax=Adlercreutzia wanghongyangiae TaxID=3111451 RepID=UPI002DB894B6|nr:PIN domain-containing protein [Adlercreutzia sp. R21]MEC4184446.1 PIN domain-containing protein [Adlercreutzia sp. R21]